MRRVDVISSKFCESVTHKWWDCWRHLPWTASMSSGGWGIWRLPRTQEAFDLPHDVDWVAYVFCRKTSTPDTWHVPVLTWKLFLHVYLVIKARVQGKRKTNRGASGFSPPHPQIHRSTPSPDMQAHPILKYTGPPHPWYTGPPQIHRPIPSTDTQAHPILGYTGLSQIHRSTLPSDTQAHPTLGYTGPPHPRIRRPTPSSDTQVVSLFYISQTYLEYPKVKYIICPNHPHLHVLYKPKCSSI